MKKVKNNQIPIKSLISNYGTKKYVTVQKIKEDSKWDGLHGVKAEQTPQEILTRYRRLWKIEDETHLPLEEEKNRVPYSYMLLSLPFV